MFEVRISPMNPIYDLIDGMAEQGYPACEMSMEDAKALMSLADEDYEFFFDAKELMETWNQVISDNKENIITAYEIWNDINVIRVDFERPTELKEDEDVVPIVICDGKVTEPIPEKAGVLILAYLDIRNDATFDAFADKLEALHLGFDYDYYAYNWGLRRYLRAII